MPTGPRRSSRWDETLVAAGAPAPRRAWSRRPILAAIFQADLDRLRAISSKDRRRSDACDLHLVDATYELFRAHFAPRPPVLGRDGSGALRRVGACRPAAVAAPRGGRDARRLRHGPRHRVVPQRPLSRLQVVGRHAPRSCSTSSRSPRRRSRRSASSCGRWSSSRPTTRSARPRSGSPTTPRVERIVVCTPDKDMAQLVRDDRIVLWDRRRELTYDDAGVRRNGACHRRRSRTGSGLVGDSSDGFPGLPGWGAKSAAAVLMRYGHYEDDPRKGIGMGGARDRRVSGHDPRGDAARPLGRGPALPRPRRLRTSDDGVTDPTARPR